MGRRDAPPQRGGLLTVTRSQSLPDDISDWWYMYTSTTSINNGEPCVQRECAMECVAETVRYGFGIIEKQGL